MKLKTLINTMTLCCLLSVTATAQQDPGDQGAADSVFVNIIQPVATGDANQVVVNLYFFNDVQNVAAASMGFSWDNPNLVMDSVVRSPEASAAFNMLGIVLYRNDILGTGKDHAPDSSGELRQRPGKRCSAHRTSRHIGQR